MYAVSFRAEAPRATWRISDTERVCELRTDRLLLRRWRPEDQSTMAQINLDPEIARYLNRPVDDAAVAGFYGQVVDHWERFGFGLWAVESLHLPLAGRFLGFVGLAHVPSFLAAAGDAPELGWRLARACWGQGFATEAAIAARDDAFSRLGVAELISVIHPRNVRSQRVAMKVGMRRWQVIENPVLGIEVDVWRVAADATKSDSV
jgi:RimJ/RimL family protein N-acetyltransferase